MLAIKLRSTEFKPEERRVQVKFYSYGRSEKGRGGVFVGWEDRKKYLEFFSEAERHTSGDPEIRVCGYGHSRKWQGDLPEDGETWLCELVRVTDGGLLLVKPLENETGKAKLEYRNAVLSQADGLEPFLKYLDDLRVDKNDSDDLMVHAVLYFLELKKFAEEKIAKAGKLQMIREMIKDEDWQLFESGLGFWNPVPAGDLASAYNTHSAEKFMDQKKSLEAIISWLERDENVVEIIDGGKRNYKCGCCQHFFRLEKSAYKNIKESGFTVRCPDCGANSGK